MTTKKGYLLLTDTGTVFTKIIKLFTKKAYNHASISFDSDLSEVYSFGRKSARNPFIGGFVKEEMNSYLFQRADCAIYSFEVTEAQMLTMKGYIEDIETQKSQYRYNFLGLFGFIINKPIKRTNAFFCSQFVASVLEKGSVIDFGKPLSLIAPNDLQELSNLEIVYQGKLKDYTNINAAEIARFPFQFRPIDA